MTWGLVLPGLASVLLGRAGGLAQRHLRPAVGVPVLAALAAMSAIATGAAVALVSFGFVAEVPWFARNIEACRRFSRSHDVVPPWLGVPASVALFAMLGATTVAAVRRRGNLRRLRRLCGRDAVQVLPTERVIAFAVPGRPGRIVVSAGMLDLLDVDERRVLFAHERSHLERRHHRFLAVAQTVAAAVPLLRPLCAQLRFATERWADEDAVTVVGDRRLVARAIARAALGAQAARPAAALPISGLGVAARVEALLVDAPSWRSIEVARIAGTAAVIVTTVAALLQVHHFAAFVAHICPV